MSDACSFNDLDAFKRRQTAIACASLIATKAFHRRNHHGEITHVKRRHLTRDQLVEMLEQAHLAGQACGRSDAAALYQAFEKRAQP